MRFNFTLNTYDFDGTQRVHQVTKSSAFDIIRAVHNKIMELDIFEQDHIKDGGSVTIMVDIRLADLNKKEAVEFNEELTFNFNIEYKDRIAVVARGKTFKNPEHLTNTEISYLQEMIDGASNLKMADHHHRKIETIKVHKTNIRNKTNCRDAISLKAYVDRNHLLG